MVLRLLSQRNVKDAVTHENVTRHAHHEVTPVVGRERDEVDIHQKVQPVLLVAICLPVSRHSERLCLTFSHFCYSSDQQEKHTHHQHVAPEVHRERGEDISDRDAAKYAQQAQHTNTQNIGEQTHSTSVNAPKVHEHVNKHIVEGALCSSRTVRDCSLTSAVYSHYRDPAGH